MNEKENRNQKYYAVFKALLDNIYGESKSKPNFNPRDYIPRWIRLLETYMDINNRSIITEEDESKYRYLISEYFHHLPLESFQEFLLNMRRLEVHLRQYEGIQQLNANTKSKLQEYETIIQRMKKELTTLLADIQTNSKDLEELKRKKVELLDAMS